MEFGCDRLWSVTPIDRDAGRFAGSPNLDSFFPDCEIEVIS
jgi:hypothetical protein